MGKIWLSRDSLGQWSLSLESASFFFYFVINCLLLYTLDVLPESFLQNSEVKAS